MSETRGGRTAAAGAMVGLGAVGTGLVGTAAYHYATFGGDPVADGLVAVTGALVLAGLASLHTVGVSPSRYLDVFVGSLLGAVVLGVVGTGAVVAAGVAPTFGVHGPALGFLLGVGAVGGLVAGLQTARARQHAARAASAEQTVDRLSEERSRFAVLNETARDILEASDRETVAARLIEEGRVGLPGPFAGVWLYNGDRDRLVPAGTTSTDPEWTPSQLWPGSAAMTAFEREEPTTVTGDEFPALDALYAVPMGRHGLLVVGAAGRLDDRATHLAEIYATTGEAAMDRIQREVELERNNERLEAFASVVAHDLRNPLNVVRGRADLLAETGDPSHGDAIRRAADRMGTIIDDVLELARGGDAVVGGTSVKLTDVVERGWSHVDTGDAGVDVGFLPSVRGDADRLTRLFENLFRNSVEHGSTTSQGASRPDDAVEHGSTSPRSQAREDSVEHGGADVRVRVGMLDGEDGVFVADDGPGIPAELRDDVFDEGVSGGGGGTGIGLAIVAQIARAHGWSVAVMESEEGGARFEFRF